MWVLFGLLVGCGPTVDPFPGRGEGQSDAGTTAPGTTTIIGDSTGASLPDPVTTGEEESTSGESSSGGPECPPLEPVAPGTDSLCTADPNAIPPVVASFGDCFDGTVSFRQSWASNGIFLFYDVSASFSTAEVQADGMTVLDSYYGTPDDCALYYGSHSVPESKVYEDVGTVTFSFGSNELVGSRSVDDAGRIRYYANAADAELEPQHLAAHGFTASGGDTPPLVFPAAVTLPEPVVLTGLLRDGSIQPVFDRDAITLTWEPGRSSFPLYAYFWTLVEGTDRLLLLCHMEDDGEFTVPPDLACHFPATDDAFVGISRTDQRLITAEDGRNIVVDADAYLIRGITLE